MNSFLTVIIASELMLNGSLEQKLNIGLFNHKYIYNKTILVTSLIRYSKNLRLIPPPQKKERFITNY